MSERPFVLVVDEPSTAGRITQALHQQYETQALSKMSDALFQLEKEQVDVLLVGPHLDDGSGTELLARAADISPLTCRIVMSSDNSAQFLLQAINQARVSHYIKKPVKIDELKGAIDEALTARGRSREALTDLLLGQSSNRGRNDANRTRPEGWPKNLVEDIRRDEAHALAKFFHEELLIGVALISPQESTDLRAWAAELELRLVTTLRETDHCFRVGSNFLVLFGHTSRRGCQGAGRRLGAGLRGGVVLQTMQWPDDAEARDPLRFAEIVLSQC